MGKRDATSMSEETPASGEASADRLAVSGAEPSSSEPRVPAYQLFSESSSHGGFAGLKMAKRPWGPPDADEKR